MDRILWSYVKTKVDLHLSLTWAFLMQMKTLDVENASFEVTWFMILLERLFYHAGRISSQAPEPLQGVMDATRSVATQYEHRYARTPQMISHRSIVTEWWLKAEGAAGTLYELLYRSLKESSFHAAPNWSTDSPEPISPSPSSPSPAASISVTSIPLLRSPTSMPIGALNTSPITVFKPSISVPKQGSPTGLTSLFRHLEINYWRKFKAQGTGSISCVGEAR